MTLDFEGVLRGAGLTDEPGKYDSDIHSWRCSYPDIYGPCTCLQEMIADLRAEVGRWLGSEGAVALLAGRMLKVESPEGLWAHLTPLERERFENHATCALAALAGCVGVEEVGA